MLGGVRRCSDAFRRVWMRSDAFGRVRTRSYVFILFLEMSRRLWTFLDVFGCVWMFVNVSRYFSDVAMVSKSSVKVYFEIDTGKLGNDLFGGFGW